MFQTIAQKKKNHEKSHICKKTVQNKRESDIPKKKIKKINKKKTMHTLVCEFYCFPPFFRRLPVNVFAFL